MRVKSNTESIKIAQEFRGSLIPTFKYDIDHTYNVIFLSDSEGGQILYQAHTHGLKFALNPNAKVPFTKVRCVKEYIDNTPDPLDTSRPKNTGRCPYCEVARKLMDKAKTKYDEWFAEHPDATKEEIKEAKQNIYGTNKIETEDTERYYLVAVLKSDNKGNNIVLDTEGNPVYDFNLLKVTSSQFKNKLMPIIEQLKANTGSDVLDYTHIIINYPDAKDKKLSAKDMTYATPIAGIDVIFKKYPKLKEKIAERVAELEKPAKEGDTPLIDTLDEKLFSFRPESEKQIESNLASVKSKLYEGMSEEDADKLQKELEQGESKLEQVDAEDIDKKFNMEEEIPEVDETSQDEVNSKFELD